MASRPGRRVEILFGKEATAINICDLLELVIKSLPELFKLAYIIIERVNRVKPITKNKRRPNRKV